MVVAAGRRRRVTPRSLNAGRVLGKAAASDGKNFVHIPNGTSDALEGLGLGYLVPTWVAISKKLRSLTTDSGVKRTGGVEPRDFKARLRTDRHVKTVERHLRLLEEHGFLERNDVPVPGRQTRFPRRGPGTRVRYFMHGAKFILPSPRSRNRPARPSAALAPPDGPQRRQEATRGPPDLIPAADPDGPQSARETLDRLKAARRP